VGEREVQAFSVPGLDQGEVLLPERFEGRQRRFLVFAPEVSGAGFSLGDPLLDVVHGGAKGRSDSFAEFVRHGGRGANSAVVGVGGCVGDQFEVGASGCRNLWGVVGVSGRGEAVRAGAWSGRW
jgi:hypothetical protein